MYRHKIFNDSFTANLINLFNLFILGDTAHTKKNEWTDDRQTNKLLSAECASVKEL